jgi:hypothetical protein
MDTSSAQPVGADFLTLQGEYFTLFVYRLRAGNASGFARIVGRAAKEGDVCPGLPRGAPPETQGA